MSMQSVLIQEVKDRLENWIKWGFDTQEATILINDLVKEFKDLK